mgnify:CR=1 FL=1
MNPSFLAPHIQRLRCAHAKEIEFGISDARPLALELRLCEPVCRKFLDAIAHVHTTEDAELEHLLGCEIWTESWVEILANWFGEFVGVVALHRVSHYYLHGCAATHTMLAIQIL